MYNTLWQASSGHLQRPQPFCLLLQKGVAVLLERSLEGSPGACDPMKLPKSPDPATPATAAHSKTTFGVSAKNFCSALGSGVYWKGFLGVTGLCKNVQSER